MIYVQTKGPSKWYWKFLKYSISDVISNINKQDLQWQPGPGHDEICSLNYDKFGAFKKKYWKGIPIFSCLVTKSVYQKTCCIHLCLLCHSTTTKIIWDRLTMSFHCQSLPEASFGLRVLSLPACVCVCVCPCVRQSRDCPRDNSSTV